MLVSLAITLVMMGAVVSLFGLISDNVSNSRSVIEISERLRATRNRLQTDLQGVTAIMKPPMRPESNMGYFELIERGSTDAQQLIALGSQQAFLLGSLSGDNDDVLMFTTRSRGEPFVGRFRDPANPNILTVESQDAEVIYFCAPALDANGNPSDAILFVDPATGTPVRTFTLYRRVLLVNPRLPGAMMPPLTADYLDNNDVSIHLFSNAGPPEVIANTLADLTKRENRFAHFPSGGATGFPYNASSTIPGGYQITSNAAIAPFTGPRLSDDVLLTNVLSFDVQVYDPGAPINVTANTALTPTDPGYNFVANPFVGAYVDLGTNAYTNNDAHFNQAVRLPINPGTNVHLTPFGLSNAFTYDTWSVHYESNGVTDHPGGSRTPDWGTDGLDNSTPANNTIDEPAEAETQAPFAAPLRGLRVIIRVYDPGSKQIRQVTVVQDFLPD